MPFKRAGWLQPTVTRTGHQRDRVSMPFKRAGWLQPGGDCDCGATRKVSMPFKRAGWLQLERDKAERIRDMFQCPLSGLVGCNPCEQVLQRAVTCFNAL